MSNPMEGMNMGKRDPIQEAWEKATATRNEAKLRHPEFFGGIKKPKVTARPATAEIPEQPKQALDGAAAHELHQRKILGPDYE